MEHALVNSPIAPLMSEPRRDCELADEALCGWELELLEEHPDGWCLAGTHYGYRGYVHRDRLAPDPAPLSWWREAPKKVITRFTADVLDAPKVQGAHVATLTRGAWVSPTGPADENGWVPVALCDRRAGWTKESFLGELLTSWDPGEEAALRENIARTALSYLGCQYRWGGRTPLGIDCSGLCHEAYLMNGVMIHRDAHMEDRYCMRPIPRERLQKADLLFFKGHVAMYLGEQKYVHSTGKSGSDGVVINSLDPAAPDYREDLAKGILQMGTIFAG